ncbi:hypothetical protein ABW21_db0200196 [Orbilia brochopaga]|nr:hypothetical protein ABW21_db0200196 [Drechslerella brochopaga]
MSGGIDATALSTGNIKHPRAAEARNHYLGPPPVVSEDDYESQFKSSVLGASPPGDGDSTTLQAETMSPVAVEDVRTEDVALPPSATPAEDTTDQDAPGEYEFPEYGRSYGLFPSDSTEEPPTLEDATGDSSDEMPEPKPSSLMRDLGPAAYQDTSPRRYSPRLERKAREWQPTPKSGSRIPTRLNRVTQTTSLPDRELSKLTARNTTRNGVYKKVNFERKVVRLEGSRPPSPTRETQTAVAEMSRSMRKRVFEETGVSLGPGDELDYVPPEWEMPPPVKRVRWHELLETRLDEREQAGFRTERGILAPERVRDEDSDHKQIVIQKFLYEGERDVTLQA